MPDGPLSVVAAAVTPVVMISATAILIGGVSTKHQALADRLRALGAEYRLQQTSAGRRENIAAQLLLFRRRLMYATLAHLGLYVAVACFLAMVMVIGLSPVRAQWTRLTLPMFLAGVLLLFGAVLAETLELLLANKTIKIESQSTRDGELGQ